MSKALIATVCPVCGELIEVVAGYEAKQIECSKLFRIVSLEPLQLAYAYDLDEQGEFFDEERPHS
jgi:hypothetical protein